MRDAVISLRGVSAHSGVAGRAATHAAGACGVSVTVCHSVTRGLGGLATLFTSYFCFENATLNTLNTSLSSKFIVSVTTRCLSEAKAANLSERAKAGRACA